MFVEALNSFRWLMIDDPTIFQIDNSENFIFSKIICLR